MASHDSEKTSCLGTPDVVEDPEPRLRLDFQLHESRYFLIVISVVVTVFGPGHGETLKVALKMLPCQESSLAVPDTHLYDYSNLQGQHCVSNISRIW